jgi:2-keto-4-pentenoate hydratase/2-oxohepta-3-ene-1,7-dioic acid hydratase in catechol pathway
MRIVRFQREPEVPPLWGWLTGEQLGLIEGTPFGDYRRQPAELSLEGLRLLAPVEPSKIICVGRNYPLHAAEHGSEVPELPLLFLKPPSTVIGPGDPIQLPPQSSAVEHEAELAIVIGKAGRWIMAEAAGDHILGYTAACDVTARDLQRVDDQWTRAKGFDSFCPIGPWIDTDLDPADAVITCTVSGQLRQMGSTRDMVYPVYELVAYISSIMTLNAGDVILTGTPSGVGPLLDGDEVTVEIEGLGSLSNPVHSASPPS